MIKHSVKIVPEALHKRRVGRPRKRGTFEGCAKARFAG